jgi:preprotein translocase YajC subunit
MTHFLALMNVLAATKKSTNPLPLIILVVIAVAGYFFFLKPQQAKARAARSNVGKGYEVGDEVQTIGGVVGTILEIHGDRYTLLTGSVGTDGNLNGAQPTRIVFVRQAIAKKIEPVVDVDVEPDDDDAEYHHDSVEIDDHDEEAEGA